MPVPKTRAEDRDWTYGAEHELSDWDCSIPLPVGYRRAPDYTIVNSNGIAAQLDTSLYGYGGEINTPPTPTIAGQVGCLETILGLYPNATVNHRSNLHCHIRVPGLSSDLPKLRKLQLYIHRELRPIINILEPIPKGRTAAEKKRERRRKKSHHTFLSRPRLVRQAGADSVDDFFAAECPQSGERVLWHLAARCCVNLRQLRETDTIEFRHFPGTLSPLKLSICLEWCRDFLLSAFQERALKPVLMRYLEKGYPFPLFPDFSEELEIGYQATACHNGLSGEMIAANIQSILNNRFVGSEAYVKARKRARGL